MSAKTAGMVLFVIGVLLASCHLASIVLALLAGNVAGITATNAVCLGVGIVMMVAGGAAYRADVKQQEEGDERPGVSPPPVARE
jgi:hypothetical protein